MTIVLGGDHAGFHHKEIIRQHLTTKGHNLIDIGPFNEESVDYPDFVHPCVQEFLTGKAEMGILVCGSGNGVAITANKYEKIRCALCWNTELSELARKHNNANFLAIPGRFISSVDALKIVDLFLETDFEGGRHSRRVNKMSPSPEYLC